MSKKEITARIKSLEVKLVANRNAGNRARSRQIEQTLTLLYAKL